MKNKAFTLIELLAVIVVLGIIMLIAVTAVSGVISNSKTNSFKTSAMMVAKQIRNEVLPMGYTNNQTIDCLNGNYGLNPNDYDYCSANISIISDVTNVYVDLVGKGNFNGLATVGATQGSATTTSNATYQSLKTVLLATVGTKDIDVNKYNGNGLYKWGSKYIFRGGITKTNGSGLDTLTGYLTDVNSGSDPNNYVKVPWETYTGGETCTDAVNNKCWRVISVNLDGSISITRDRNESNQIFDNAYNTAAGGPYGYNDLLGNIPTSGHPEEYRPYSLMYNKLYGITGYENTVLKNYYNLLNTIDVCLNKADGYSGVNLTNYATTESVTNTCNVTGKSWTTVVNPLPSKYVRLPYIEEYLNASLETTCTGDYQFQCRNQNFMYNNLTYWLLTGHSSNTTANIMRVIYRNGHAGCNGAEAANGVKPVVNLKSTVLISGGTGSTSDPYVIKN